MNNIKPIQKKVLAIHDISCIGRCSLTVALPILSAAGHNTGVIPTAILSTHTGEFTDYVVHDLSSEILPISKHLSKCALNFDAIYTGYLANATQIEQIISVFNILKKSDTMIYVDPAFADNGELYALMDMNMVEGMRKLISHADIIIPNITETMFLLGLDPKLNCFSENQLCDIAQKFIDLGPKKIIITGIAVNDTTMGTFYMDENSNYALVKNSRYNGIFHGTGDVIASTILASLLNGLSFKNALEVAVEFTSKSIEATIEGKEPLKYGIRFEKVLPWLISKIIQN